VDPGNMIMVQEGTFLMGAMDFYPEERPLRLMVVNRFWIDECPVTNAQFRCFVEDTGYVTVAERPVTKDDYPDADPSMLVPGSLVFHQATVPVDLRDVRNWWSYLPGATWQHPHGADSDLNGLETHPVVHVAYEDAYRYAQWAGKELPTEAEWEYAARGGLPGATYAWGDEFAPEGQHMANVWIGEFPWQKRMSEYETTSPVRAFPPNGYGIYDMIGNVWEWTADRFALPASSPTNNACCSASQSATTAANTRVVKGGSHLCAPNYCRRYRPSARQPQSVDTSSSHIGFRCVRREPIGGRISA
jgi:formylglycine-generating enzyme